MNLFPENVIGGLPSQAQGGFSAVKDIILTNPY
jgi:hypothetical protein